MLEYTNIFQSEVRWIGPCSCTVFQCCTI